MLAGGGPKSKARIGGPEGKAQRGMSRKGSPKGETQRGLRHGPPAPLGCSTV